MTIHGLQPRLAEGGKIKIGGLGEVRQGQNGPYRLPVKHDSFTITTTMRDENGDLTVDEVIMRELEREYADRDGQLRTIPIVVHSDDIEEIFPTSYVRYAGKRMACRGDGRKAEQREIKAGKYTGATKELECPCSLLEPDDKGERRCKPSGRFHCSLRVSGQAVAGAVHRFTTTSIISIEQLIGSLLQIRQTVGVIRGLPLVLRVRPVVVSPPGKPSSTVYVVHAELRATDLQTIQRQALELAQMRNAVAGALGGPPDRTPRDYRAMLQAPGLEDADEQARVAAEFYPPALPDVEIAYAPTAEMEAKLRAPTAPREAPPPVEIDPDTGEVLEIQPQEPQNGAPAGEEPRAGTTTPPPETDDSGPPACVGSKEGRMEGEARRSRCRGGGGLYWGAMLHDGLCPTCRPPAAAETPPQEPQSGPPVDEPAPAGTTAPDPMAKANCARCDKPQWSAQLSAEGLCGECQIVTKTNETPKAPARPSTATTSAPEQSPRDRFVAKLTEMTRQGKIDGTKALAAVMERFPKLAEADAKGDYDIWTDEVADQAIAVLDREAASKG